MGHHCPFVNNCIGQRNYFFFFGFVTSVSILALTVLPSIFFYFVVGGAKQADDTDTNEGDSESDGSTTLYIGAALGVLVGVAALAAIGLWCYHAYLISTGQTTREHQKRITDIDKDPTACAPRGPRLFDPRALVDLAILKSTAGM